jgi:hypothetical protein
MRLKKNLSEASSASDRLLEKDKDRSEFTPNGLLGSCPLVAGFRSRQNN